VSLTWSASNDNVGVAGYKVTRNGAQVATVTGTSWSDTGLASGTTYTYTVAAYDASSNTSGTATTSDTTLNAVAPSSPVLSGTLNRKHQPRLSWTASTSSAGIVGYRVYRNGVLVATTSKRTRSWTDTTSGSGTFQYYVVAYDAANATSAPSNTVTLVV
jgi:chitodextrinase